MPSRHRDSDNPAEGTKNPARANNDIAAFTQPAALNHSRSAVGRRPPHSARIRAICSEVAINILPRAGVVARMLFFDRKAFWSPHCLADKKLRLRLPGV